MFRSMMSFEQFKAYYEENGRCVNDIQPRSKPLNQKQLDRRYQQYVQSQKRREERYEDYKVVDDEWVEVREYVLSRDRYTCRLTEVLTDEERERVTPRDEYNPFACDPAHVFPRSTHPHLAYDTDNVVALCRLFHSRLDTFRNPLNGLPLSKAQHREWWERIVGGPRLLKKIENKKEQRSA